MEVLVSRSSFRTLRVKFITPPEATNMGPDFNRGSGHGVWTRPRRGQQHGASLRRGGESDWNLMGREWAWGWDSLAPARAAGRSRIGT